jgi:hypothetical protein
MMPSAARSDPSTACVVDAISTDEIDTPNMPRKNDSGIMQMQGLNAHALVSDAFGEYRIWLRAPGLCDPCRTQDDPRKSF